MRLLLLACLLALFATGAQARCYKDAIGGGSTCDVNNQARKGAALTKSDATTYSPPTKMLYIGDAAACTIAVLFADDTVAMTMATVQPGVAYPFAVKKLMSTNTTCTTVVGLF